MALATWIVPPMSEALIMGFTAVELTARKAYLRGGAEGKRLMSCYYSPKDSTRIKTFAEWVKFIKEKQNPDYIRSCYIDGKALEGGSKFGVDSVTAVKFVFSNRIPSSAYASFTLGDVGENPKVQEWIKENQTVFMSKVQLIRTLSDLAKLELTKEA